MNTISASSNSRAVGFFLIAVFGSVLGGCGGGGSGGGDTLATYSISGVISSHVTGAPLSGVEVSLTGPAAAMTTTDANGGYSFADVPKGTYTITPTSANAEFSPASQSTSVSSSNVTSADFSGIRGAAVASGIDFLPSTFSSTDQLRASLVLAAGSAFFTDSTDQPLKRVSLNNSAITPFASRIGTPESVLLMGQSVFWVDGGRLNATSIDGASTTLLATGERDPLVNETADIVADGSYVYWVNTISSLVCSPSCTSIIRRVPLAGGAPVTLATVNAGRLESLAGDSNNLYWQEANSINMVPKSGGAVVTLVDYTLNGATPPPGQSSVCWYPTGGLAITSTQIFFAGSCDGRYDIFAVPIAGGEVTTLTSVSTGSDIGVVDDIRVDATRIYWIDAINGELDAMPIGGGDVTSLASVLRTPSLGNPVSLAIASDSAYWTEPGTFSGCCTLAGSGSVKRVLFAGGAVTTIVSGVDSPAALDLGSTNLVWAEAWRVGKAPSSGGAASTIASGVSSDMARIAADQNNIYVLDGDWIKKAPISGGQLEKLSSANGGIIDDLFSTNQDIATDGTRVYWTVGNPIGSPTVWAVSVAGGSPNVLSGGGDFGSPQDCYWRIAVVGSSVFWSSTTSHFPVGCTVRSVPVGGGATTTLVDEAYLRDFTVDGSNVYFSEFSSGTIKKTPVGSGATTTVASNARAWVLTNDTTNLYWIDTNPSNGGIGSVSKSRAGGSAEFPILGPIVTDPLLTAEAITLDQGTLYWTETGSGDVYVVE